MAMTLGSMSSIATQTLNLANKAATSATSDPLTKSLGIANQRVTDQLSQTNVQLSSYGQIKSGFAALQTTGKTLSTLTKDATASDVSKAAQSFASAFNSTTNAVSSAVNGSAGKSGALANDQLARLSGNDLRRVITNSGGASELQKIGISVGQSGTLTVDSKALEKALAANPDAVKGTLSKLGQQAGKTATQELSSGGAVGSAMTSLNNRAKTLTTQQTQQQNAAALIHAALQQSSDQFNGFGGLSAGISAYMKTFSL